MIRLMLFCAAALVVCSNTYASVIYSYEGPAVRAYGTLDGYSDESPIPIDWYTWGNVIGTFSINTDPSVVLQENISDEQRRLSFSSVSVTAAFENVPSPSPITYSNATARFTDNLHDYDMFEVLAKNVFQQGDIEYTQSFYLQTWGEEWGSFLEPLNLPLLNSDPHGRSVLSYSISQKNISGTCTLFCSSGWNIGNSGYTVELAVVTPAVPIPGAAWLFCSALAIPLFSKLGKLR